MPRTATMKLDSLADLKQYEGTLYVRNNTNKAVSCNTKNHQLLLSMAGQDGSVQPIHPECLNQAGFVSLWRRGDLTIAPDLEDDVTEAAARQTAAEEKRVNELNTYIEQSNATKDLTEAKCLISGETVFQTVQEVRDLVPPLAERYKDRAHEFVPTEVESNGETRTAWNRVQIT